MGDAISISQNEIDSLLGFMGVGNTAVETPTPAKSPPSAENRSSAKAEEFKYQPFTDTKKDGTPASDIDLIKDIPLELTVELGRSKKSISDILEFGLGTVVELNRLAGEPVDLMANGKLIAKGEVVVIDENFAIRITEILTHSKRKP